MAGKHRLVIVGAGGHGSEVQSYVRDLIAHQWDGELLGFLDDHAPRGHYRNVDVIGTLEDFREAPPAFFENLFYLTAFGSNPLRRTVVGRLEAAYGTRMQPWTLRHPSAYTGEDVEIGAGTLLAPEVVITSRVKIGRHCILNVKASVSHDSVVGDYANLNPGATVCGNCRIGEDVYLGAGATVIDRVSIGSGTIVGAGATVIHDLEPNVTAVGVPARVIKRN